MPGSSEREPLLEQHNDARDPEEGDQGHLNEETNTWSADLKDIVQLAGPAILQLAFQQAVIVTNQSMAGHLGEKELAAAAIAVTWFNLMWFFILGASSALDTLASQAFGAGDRPGVISWAASSVVVLSIMAVPMAFALYFADSVALVVFRQSHEIAELVGIYCHGILPGLWPFIWSLIIMKAMQAQNRMWAPTIVTICMFFSNIVINLVFIKLLGFVGAAYAQSASRIALFLFLVVYISSFGRSCIHFDRATAVLEEDEDLEKTKPNETDAAPVTTIENKDCEDAETEPMMNGVNKQYNLDDIPYAHPHLGQIVRDGLSINRLTVFLQLGFAGGLMMAADASSFDITTAMAGFIGVEEVGAHTSLLTIMEFIYTSVPFGIATAATIRVGNRLGAGNAKSARQSAYICMAICSCFSLIVMILFFTCGGYFGYIFTNDKVVISIVARLSILGGIWQIPDCIYGTVSGILRGTGCQATLMWANLAGFWGVGTPLCYYLAFVRNMGIEGLWIGLIAGLSTSACLVLIMLLRLDWEKEAESAQELAALRAAMEEDGMEAEEEADSVTTLEEAENVFPLDPAGSLSPRRSLRSRTSNPRLRQLTADGELCGRSSAQGLLQGDLSQPIEIQERLHSGTLRVGSLPNSFKRSTNIHL